jgi:ATP-binding cassette, subfamily B, bacterial
VGRDSEFASGGGRGDPHGKEGSSPRRRQSVYEAARTPMEKKKLRFLPGLVIGALRLVWRSGRREFLLCAGLQAISGVGLAVQLLVARSVLSAILRTDDLGGGFATVLPQLLVLAGLTTALSLADLLRAEEERVLAELVGRRSSDELLEVAGAVDLAAYETPSFYDRLQRASFNAGARPVLMVKGLLQMLSGAFSITAVIVAMSAIQPALVPLAIVAYLPYWAATSRNSKAFYDFSYGMTADDRTRNYLFNLLTGQEFAKEVRAFGVADYFRRLHARLYDARIMRLREVVRGRLRRSIAASLSNSLLSGGAVALLVWLLLSGRMTVAETATAVWAVVILGQRMRGINSGAGSLYESALFIEDFTSFLDIGPRVEAAKPARLAPRGFDHLVVEEVGFTYPESSAPALEGISLEIHKGQTVALVGENGSGKTTLAKLLAHLHLPDRGRILWDGVDVAECEPDELRRSIAVLFQDFVRYHLSANDNIGLGRVDDLDNRPGIVDAARRAEADAFLSTLPEGYDTLLSRRFTGGIDLSIGQWQRVSLARAFFRDASFLIMDEPTAALDARAESEIFERMRILGSGRPLLLISHRFSSVRSADHIYVMHGGRIVEHGTHSELMELGGRYSEMFMLQASAYLDSPSDKPVAHSAEATWDPDLDGAPPRA